MVSYFDTSALVKHYTEESGSSRVQHLIDQAEEILTTALTELELVSFTERSKRGRHIDSPTYRTIGQAIEKDIRSGDIGLIEISPEILKNALRLIRQHRLKVQDAIQLATAVALHQRTNGACEFICSDLALLETARLEGLCCIDPTQ